MVRQAKESAEKLLAAINEMGIVIERQRLRKEEEAGDRGR